ncbi:ABC transporter permease [Roseibium sp. SCP14]|uniref:ABC transporter permease n=1 Tax=Roseibium sp. SCP14 TaxID=3141375 RepID=UPI003339C166
MKNIIGILSRTNGQIGFGLLAIVFLAALFGAIHPPYDPIATNFSERFLSPGEKHLLGTDMFGRDLLSRILVGASSSVLVSLLTVILTITFGVLLGSICGLLRGWFDRGVMMVLETLMAFPGLLLALALMTIIGPNKYGVIFALSLAYLPSVTRLVRGTVMSIREKEYVEASIALGNSMIYTLFRHILPNCVAPLIVFGSAMFGWVLLAESALSFLGLGVPPPAPTWGNMLAEARTYLIRFPWLGVLPGICIAITLLGVNFFGDALRDKLDPRSVNKK